MFLLVFCKYFGFCIFLFYCHKIHSSLGTKVSLLIAHREPDKASFTFHNALIYKLFCLVRAMDLIYGADSLIESRNGLLFSVGIVLQ